MHDIINDTFRLINSKYNYNSHIFYTIRLIFNTYIYICYLYFYTLEFIYIKYKVSVQHNVIITLMNDYYNSYSYQKFKYKR